MEEPEVEPRQSGFQAHALNPYGMLSGSRRKGKRLGEETGEPSLTGLEKVIQTEGSWFEVVSQRMMRKLCEERRRCE